MFVCLFWSSYTLKVLLNLREENRLNGCPSIRFPRRSRMDMSRTPLLGVVLKTWTQICIKRRYSCNTLTVKGWKHIFSRKRNLNLRIHLYSVVSGRSVQNISSEQNMGSPQTHTRFYTLSEGVCSRLHINYSDKASVWMFPQTPAVPLCFITSFSFSAMDTHRHAALLPAENSRLWQTLILY